MRQGRLLAVTAVGLARAVPSFAVIVIALPVTVALGLGIGFWPTLIALVLLAVPVIFTNAFTGVLEVEPNVVESATGMGLTPRQILFSVEIPLAAPLIVAGLKIAAVQVVATATLGALVGWGGLGRYIVDGLAQQNNAEVFDGALLVAALALITLAGFSALERAVTRGEPQRQTMWRRFRKRRRARREPEAAGSG
jgi:osmoprotectant transport system permease protein